MLWSRCLLGLDHAGDSAEAANLFSTIRLGAQFQAVGYAASGSGSGNHPQHHQFPGAIRQPGALADEPGAGGAIHASAV